ncbi:uroporphyrinogen-III synthase [Halorubrum sp. AD140]|uniref:uroporphyrinogen-III synthase n=1 Tax=Halorubrum sp. AD140 TaxID=3050073 RepID=UPI002ACCEA0D|nr:uroporphyrinogen-III synthase [Halorubrum sp. AD140]MDZ5812354.1 uroporphyrinogen-III synthase [Halorubrum sp. AD140]
MSDADGADGGDDVRVGESDGTAESDAPRVAVFRPADERIDDATALLESLGVDPVADPMLAVEPTGAVPAEAPYVVLTSKTGVELAAEAGWKPGDSTLVAIGPATAEAARDAGWAVDLVPDEYTSAGLVEALAERVDGERVEVARSDHGSDVLLDGLRAAGASVNETVLYRLTRPEGAGESAELAAAGALDAAAFTSSLTVTHFLDAAAERGVRDAAIAGLNDAVVGAIGPPTARTAADHGVEASVVPADADFAALARAVVDALAADSTAAGASRGDASTDR